MTSLGHDRDFRYVSTIAVEHGLAKIEGTRVQYHTSTLIFIADTSPFSRGLANLRQSLVLY